MQQTQQYDIVLIGAGVMSITLGAFLHELNPNLKIHIIERLPLIAGESTDALNNAGTGHSALCELNYTPQKADGSIDISKAIDIIESFEVSKQFWAYLVEEKYIVSPSSFINSVPHMSLVFGDENVQYLQKRYNALQTNHLFHGMEYSTNPKQLREWMPLVMQNRDEKELLAATHIEIGTDIDFGALTRAMTGHLINSPNIILSLQHEVKSLNQKPDGRRIIKAYDIPNKTHKTLEAGFVFIGAGGGALPLLQKSHIEERKGLGGFPVSGQWLICNNPEIIEKHAAKVYGKAALGAPPMSVPHLDTRIINGKKQLLFGPYAGFTTKFLKKGSFLDLPLSIHIYNIRTMLGAGVHNIPLTKYLIDQVRQSTEDRLDALREFVVDAKKEDWDLKDAGFRVQIMKADKKEGGKLQFGTEVIVSADNTLSTLLGASPGASTSVSIMLDLIEKAFPEKLNEWKPKLVKMIPSYGKKLTDDKELAKKVREWSHGVLGLKL